MQRHNPWARLAAVAVLLLQPAIATAIACPADGLYFETILQSTATHRLAMPGTFEYGGAMATRLNCHSEDTQCPKNGYFQYYNAAGILIESSPHSEYCVTPMAFFLDVANRRNWTAVQTFFRRLPAGTTFIDLEAYGTVNSPTRRCGPVSFEVCLTDTAPTASPSTSPATSLPTVFPTANPSSTVPTAVPSASPTSGGPTRWPTSAAPTASPTASPTATSSHSFGSFSTAAPSSSHPTTAHPTRQPSVSPASALTRAPTTMLADGNAAGGTAAEDTAASPWPWVVLSLGVLGIAACVLVQQQRARATNTVLAELKHHGGGLTAKRGQVPQALVNPVYAECG